jgi:hypothetical protein
MFSLNGSTPSEQERGLRWIWFGGSIISDWNNPIATTNRAVIRALQHHGHQVLYIEPSDHPAFHDALRARGSAIYRAFVDIYPDIHYRRESLPGGSEGDVWLSRETALADVLVVQDDAPAQIIDWLTRMPASPIARIFIASSGQTTVVPALFDLILTPDQPDSSRSYPPAVLAPTGPALDRERELTVIYGGVKEAVIGAVAAGAGAPPDCSFEPEARLSDRYPGIGRVTLYDDDPSPFALARAMLAVAAGAEVTLVRAGNASQTVSRWNDAAALAERLIEQVAGVRTGRRAVEEERER